MSHRAATRAPNLSSSSSATARSLNQVRKPVVSCCLCSATAARSVSCDADAASRRTAVKDCGGQPSSSAGASAFLACMTTGNGRVASRAWYCSLRAWTSASAVEAALQQCLLCSLCELARRLALPPLWDCVTHTTVSCTHGDATMGVGLSRKERHGGVDVASFDLLRETVVADQHTWLSCRSSSSCTSPQTGELRGAPVCRLVCQSVLTRPVCVASSQPMEELEQEVPPGKEVECLTQRLQGHFKRCEHTQH